MLPLLFLVTNAKFTKISLDHILIGQYNISPTFGKGDYRGKPIMDTLKEMVESAMAGDSYETQKLFEEDTIRLVPDGAGLYYATQANRRVFILKHYQALLLANNSKFRVEISVPTAHITADSESLGRVTNLWSGCRVFMNRPYNEFVDVPGPLEDWLRPFYSPIIKARWTKEYETLVESIAASSSDKQRNKERVTDVRQEISISAHIQDPMVAKIKNFLQSISGQWLSFIYNKGSGHKTRVRLVGVGATGRATQYDILVSDTERWAFLDTPREVRPGRMRIFSNASNELLLASSDTTGSFKATSVLKDEIKWKYPGKVSIHALLWVRVQGNDYKTFYRKYIAELSTPPLQEVHITEFIARKPHPTIIRQL